MAEEFQGGVCGGNWWNSSRNLFGSSPCSLASNDVGSFSWMNNHDPIMDMKTASWSSDDSACSASDDVHKIHETIPMMGNWNHDLLHDNGRSDNYSNFLQEGATSMNYEHQAKFDDFHHSINSFKQVNHSFPLEESNSVSTCYSASYSHVSSLLQTLFDTDTDQSQQSLLDNQAMNYSSAPNYPINSNGFSQASPMVNPSFAKQQPTNSTCPLTNNAPLWNRSTFIPSTQSQFPSSLSNKKPNPAKFSAKHQNEEGTVSKKASNEPAFKRPRIQTPSPLPTFKVRKEKLGDRITALQQLVSPFGKTDTASVLQEAIEYIKFLHHQVNEFSTPYLKYGSPPLQRQQVANKPKNQEGLMQDLKSRGLCLVPISSTFPVAAETTTDFWTPTFGGSLK